MSMVGPNNDTVTGFGNEEGSPNTEGHHNQATAAEEQGQGSKQMTDPEEQRQDNELPKVEIDEIEDSNENDDLSNSETVDKEDSNETDTSKWVPFLDPAPMLVKARFSITEINLPANLSEEGKEMENKDELLQMLIADGIPVSYVEDEPEDDVVEEHSDIGVILPPRKSLTEDTLNLPSPPQKTENSPSNVDDIVEVVGFGKPISAPLYLQYLPTQPTLRDSSGHVLPSSLKRRGSAINPSMLQLSPQQTTLTIKKKVRFNLPGRKISLVGEYEILPPHLSSYHQRRKRHRAGGGGSGRNRKMGTTETEGLRDVNGAAPKRDSVRNSRRGNRKGIPEEGEMMLDGDTKSPAEDPEGDHRDKPSGKKEDRSDNSNNIDYDDDYDDYYDEFTNDDDDVREPAEYEEDEVFEDDSASVNIYEDDPETKCGFLTWTPDFLQPLARSELYLLIFCVVALTQGMTYSYTISIVSTIQKRFNLSSTQAGIVLIGNDMSQIATTVFVAFYGTYANRPQWLGIASMMSAFAAVIAALPHFIYGSGEIAEYIAEDAENSTTPYNWIPKVYQKIELCNVKISDNCTDMNDGHFGQAVYLPLVLLLLSQLMVGAANSVFWSLGVSYLDDNVNKKNTSVYIGLFTIARVLGPTMGFLFGAYCLSYWIDPSKSVDLALTNPKWLGAWWIGFLFLASMIGIPGLFYFCFPKRLPHKNMNNYYIQPTQYFVNGYSNYAYQSQKPGAPGSSLRTSKLKKMFSGFPPIKELPRALTRLFTNKVWMANMLSNVCIVLAMSSYFVYKPNYVQTQFRKSSSAANFYTGITTMVASVIGIAFSAVVYGLFRPRTSYVTGFNIFLSIYGIISFFALMTIHCPSNELAGHLPGQDRWACSEHCSCSEVFSPICAEDGVTTFYSPCYAGCTQVNIKAEPYEYLNCTCFGRIRWDESLNHEEYFDDEVPGFFINEGWALDGYCLDNCKALGIYLMIHLISKVMFAIGKIGGTLINLRSVEEKDKTLALGCLAAFVSLAGFIPASIIMGKAIDSTCIVWDEVCGERGSCSFYDNERLRLLMHVIPAAFLVLAGIGDIIVHMNNSSLRIYGYDDEENFEDYEVKNLRKKSRHSGRHRRSRRYHK